MPRRLNHIDWHFVAIIGAAVALLAVTVFIAWLDIKQWREFKVAHDCKVVAHISGSTFNTVSVGANGQASIGVGSVPPKTGWLCDDGVTYYR